MYNMYVCARAYTRVRVVRPSKFSVRGKDRSFHRNYCYPRGSSNLRVVNSPLMHDPARTNLACIWMRRYQYIAQMIRIKGNSRLCYYGIHVFSSPPVAVIFFLFLFFFDKLSLSFFLSFSFSAIRVACMYVHVENVNARRI